MFIMQQQKLVGMERDAHLNSEYINTKSYTELKCVLSGSPMGKVTLAMHSLYLISIIQLPVTLLVWLMEEFGMYPEWFKGELMNEHKSEAADTATG